MVKSARDPVGQRTRQGQATQLQALNLDAIGRLGNFCGDIQIAAKWVGGHGQRGVKGGQAGRKLGGNATDAGQFNRVIEHTIEFGFVEPDALQHVRCLAARVVFLEQGFDPGQIRAVKLGRRFNRRCIVQHQPGQHAECGQHGSQATPGKQAFHSGWLRMKSAV